MPRSFLQAASSTANATSYTFSSQSLGAEDADRYIIVCVASRATSGTVSISGVTVGGISASVAVSRTNDDSNNNICAQYIVAVPTGTTGDVVVTFAAGQLRCWIALYRAVDIDSPTPHDTDSSIVEDPVGSIDVPAGGFAIGAAISASGGSVPSFSWSGITEDVDETVESNTRMSSASDEFVSSQTPLAITADTSVAGLSPIGVFASWAPAAGDATTPPPTRRKFRRGFQRAFSRA